MTSNQQGTLPVGTTFESFEASITCIALLNRMQGIKYQLKCKVKFGSSFDDAFHLGNIANSINNYFDIVFRDETITDTVEHKPINEILNVSSDNCLTFLKNNFNAFYYEVVYKYELVLRDEINDLYCRLKARYHLSEALMTQVFNDYIKGLKNREKITINLNEIADKINVRVDNLKNKPEPNAILGATVLVQFCAHKYNYDVLEFGFNFCVIKKRFLSSYDKVIPVNDMDNCRYKFELGPHYVITLFQLDNLSNVIDFRSQALKRVEYTFLQILLENPLGIDAFDMAEELNKRVNRYNMQQPYNIRDVNAISRGLRYLLKKKFYLADETSGVGRMFFCYENYTYKLEPYVLL